MTHNDELADILVTEIIRESLSEMLGIPTDLIADDQCSNTSFYSVQVRRISPRQPPSFSDKGASFSMFEFRPNALMTWCRETLGYEPMMVLDWETTSVTLSFRNDQEAALFKLNWF